jgi:hypothetical protein
VVRATIGQRSGSTAKLIIFTQLPTAGKTLRPSKKRLPREVLRVRYAQRHWAQCYLLP